MNFLKKIKRYLNLKEDKNQVKEVSELRYWKTRKEQEKTLTNAHYKYFYTAHFSLADEFFNDKKVLDIGCGPRGSLEWADMAEERVGLDPLADDYLKLGADKHKMKYVKAYSEAIPFTDNYFDVICSFNSIDHVEDLEKTCNEIKRVLKPGGIFLLLVDIHENPTVCEPQTISWGFVQTYFPEFALVYEEHYEKLAGGMYESIRSKVAYDHKDTHKRYGILSAKLKKPEVA